MKAFTVLLLTIAFLSSGSAFAKEPAPTGHYAIVPDTGQACTKLKRPNDNSGQARFWDPWQKEKEYVYGEIVCGDGDVLYRVIATKTTNAVTDVIGWEKLKDRCSTSLSQYDVGAGGAVKAQDGISISALQASIADFKDGMGSKTGEIALVVSARERTDNKRAFGENAAKAGRVVFFQENVGVRTPLNFSNLSIYGPAIYQGYPLSLTLQLVEIDEKERKYMRALLPAVVNLTKTFTGANPVVTSFIDSIGSLLIASNKDDILLEYHMEFDPLQPGTRPAYPILEYGTYVYLAAKKATEWIGWDKVYYNQRNGRLFSDAQCTLEPIKDQSWIVFQVKPGDRERIVSDNEPTRLADITEAQSKAYEDSSKALAKTVEVFTLEHRSEIAFSKFLSVARSVSRTSPAAFGTNTKATLTEMLTEISNHYTGSISAQGVGLSTTKVKRLLQELVQVQFDDDAQRNADAALPFHYESFSLAAAKASLKL